MAMGRYSTTSGPTPPQRCRSSIKNLDLSTQYRSSHMNIRPSTIVGVILTMGTALILIHIFGL